jgi:hypothetical protein
MEDWRSLARLSCTSTMSQKHPKLPLSYLSKKELDFFYRRERRGERLRAKC